MATALGRWLRLEQGRVLDACGPDVLPHFRPPRRIPHRPAHQVLPPSVCRSLTETPVTRGGTSREASARSVATVGAKSTKVEAAMASSTAGTTAVVPAGHCFKIGARKERRSATNSEAYAPFTPLLDEWVGLPLLAHPAPDLENDFSDSRPTLDGHAADGYVKPLIDGMPQEHLKVLNAPLPGRLTRENVFTDADRVSRVNGPLKPFDRSSRTTFLTLPDRSTSVPRAFACFRPAAAEKQSCSYGRSNDRGHAYKTRVAVAPPQRASTGHRERSASPNGSPAASREGVGPRREGMWGVVVCCSRARRDPGPRSQSTRLIFHFVSAWSSDEQPPALLYLLYGLWRPLGRPMARFGHIRVRVCG